VRADGAGAADPGQLVLLNNADTDRVLPVALRIQSDTGGITTGIDLSDDDIVTALSLGANDVSGSNFSISGTSGDITTSGDLAVNGGNLTASTTTFNLLNTSVATLNVGGAATSLNLGSSTGTATINNDTVNFANATTFTAEQSLASFDSLSVGGGYGSTGVTVSNAGTIQANGNLTVDGTTILTGDVTATGNIALNGGDLSTTNTNASLFNTSATNILFGGDATAIVIGADTGTTTINNNLAVSTGDTLTANGGATFNPDSTNDITINTDSDSTFIITGLQTASGSLLCLDGFNNVVQCAGDSISLQSAYDGGNTIDTTSANDIAFTLSDTAADANFTITTATGASGYTAFQRADGAGTTDPSQLVLIENLDTDRTQPVGLKIQSESGGIATAIDLSDADLVTALNTGENDLSGSNWDIAGATGTITTSGDIAINGGDLTTSGTSFNLLNSGVTTLNVGGGATTLNVGANTGTATINNATVTFANASVFTANNAAASFDSVQIGGGYGSTGVSVSNDGTIQANGNLTIDGTSTLTGNVTTAADIAVNGGDLTTTAGTASLFNTNAITINIGGTATAVSIGASSGTTTINNNLTVTGNTTLNGSITANNAATFSPSGTNDITFTTDADSTIVLNGLQADSGSLLCRDGANNLVVCDSSAISLQAAYDGGNTIDTANNSDIAFTLSDTATDSNFVVTTATGSNGGSQFVRADGAGAADPSQLVLIDNADTDRALPVGLRIQSDTGGITTAIDLSDAEIGTALSLGANDISATNFSLTGSNGNITTAGDVAINGGDVTTTSGTAALFNTNATTVNVAGAATSLNLGATNGTTTIRNAAITFSNATTFNALSAAAAFDAVTVGGGYGATGVTLSSAGNVQANGNLTVDGTSTLTGNVTAAGDIAINGGDLTTTQTNASLFNTNATTLNLGGSATTIAIGASTGTTTVNNALTTTGLITANAGATVASGQTFTANGAATFAPDSTSDITFTTDADSTIVLNGLQTASGSLLCLDGSNNLVACSGSSISLQGAYTGGNAIATSDNRDIAFTLSDTTTDSNFNVTTAAGASGYSAFTLTDGTNTTPPSQLVLLDNRDTDDALATGLRIQSESGSITTAIDVSDPEIVTALSTGDNDLSGSQWSINGSNGNIATNGDIAINGGNLTSSQTTFNLANSGVTSLNVGGGATTLNLGASTGTATINNATVNFANATSFTADSALATFDTLQIGGGYGSTGVTVSNVGAIQANGNLTIDGTSTLTGNVSTTGDVAVNGGDITTTAGTASLFNTNATTVNIAGTATAVNLGASIGTTTINNALTSAGLITANAGATISSGQTLTALGDSTFTPSGANDVTINTDSDSFLTLTGLQTASGTLLCVD
ncbi:MAG: beta strand repeat-containing protein, partial [Acidobacteriota bacterium]